MVLGNICPKLLFFAEQDWIGIGHFVVHSLSLFSHQVWKIITLTCQFLLNVQHIGMEFVSGEITLERLLSFIASKSNEDAQ
jgi:hypothetical protein